ncbi:acyl-CoA-like ligand-binding transcription factor [Haloactinomyces albus]|uniref:MftR C-terminal domain-containing protein n=1 Tax=Haloactinomyces albus TaxID=1352928 RepID=A0AAE3Z7Q0_9ACTN|nr:hypothetical protein [Haloactinomyces albus]MDR7299856.1 hypothetical protein [Haloactinomyces albus]
MCERGQAQYLRGQTQRAQRLDRSPHDLGVHITASATIGAVMGTLRHWHRADFAYPLQDALEQTFRMLEDLKPL